MAGTNVTPRQGGKGRNGFPYDESETKVIVREMLDAATGAEKDGIAKHYNTSVATLNKKAVELGMKDAPTPRAKPERKPTSTVSRKRTRDEMVADLNEHITALEAELSKAKAQKEQLDAIDDDMLELIRELL